MGAAARAAEGGPALAALEDLAAPDMPAVGVPSISVPTELLPGVMMPQAAMAEVPMAESSLMPGTEGPGGVMVASRCMEEAMMVPDADVMAPAPARMPVVEPGAMPEVRPVMAPVMSEGVMGMPTIARLRGGSEQANERGESDDKDDDLTLH